MRKHHDVQLLVRLMETLPEAEAAAGEVRNMEADVMEIGAHIATSPTPAGARPPRCCGRFTSTTSSATAPPRRERAPGTVVITQNA